MNVELLLEVKKAILEEPLRIDMDTWANQDLAVPCGTVGCIYGWGQALQTGLRGVDLWNYIRDTVIDCAGSRVGPSENPFEITNEQASRLYFWEKWPLEYKNRLKVLFEQTPGYAQVVADRIDHFIATEGRE